MRPTARRARDSGAEKELKVSVFCADKSRHDLTTYSGRLRHFAEVTSPLTLLKSKQQLLDAQTLVSDYAAGKRPDLHGKEDVVLKAKQRALCSQSIACG